MIFVIDQGRSVINGKPPCQSPPSVRKHKNGTMECLTNLVGDVVSSCNSFTRSKAGFLPSGASFISSDKQDDGRGRIQLPRCDVSHPHNLQDLLISYEIIVHQIIECSCLLNRPPATLIIGKVRGSRKPAITGHYRAHPTNQRSPLPVFGAKSRLGAPRIISQPFFVSQLNHRTQTQSRRARLPWKWRL